ncbi:ABC transporter ATP-binding protein [Companilactobacillus sp. RD055328]|uniref:ABC transporter ATP-binding protein n=1 Tax=Companilactobacillus sp. RD055328 TaxID=2916634 RepID=UPI0035D078B0
MSMEEKVIEIKNITKKFGDFVANDKITLDLYRGEILALLGENGAGKSTLMGMLSGINRPTSGIIKVHGQKVQIQNPRVSNDLGIGMVYQHFMQVPVFTVLENIILGSEPIVRGRIDYKKATKEVEEIIEKYNLNISLKEKVENISVGMQQRVEIIKALYRKANVIIFDEPTAALTPQEIDELLVIFKKLCDEGKSIIFITHKLKEIKQTADRCAVIRAGKIIDIVDVQNTSEEQLAEAMIGHKIMEETKKVDHDYGNNVLNIKELALRKHQDLVSLQVAAGEIVGIAGVDGNGQNELVEFISGLKKFNKGDIEIVGSKVKSKSIREINELGFGFIPEDRQKTGLVLPFTVANNLALKTFYQPQFSSFGWLNNNAINSYAKKLISQFDIRTRSEKTLVEDLSGGNQQKVVVAREVANHPKLLVAVNPTRGVDIGASEYIHEQIIEQRNSGCGVLLISFELDEILKLSDRILVMSDGKIVGEVNPTETTSEELGLLMAGENNE